jgi:hypothetical protein
MTAPTKGTKTLSYSARSRKRRKTPPKSSINIIATRRADQVSGSSWLGHCGVLLFAESRRDTRSTFQLKTTPLILNCASYSCVQFSGVQPVDSIYHGVVIQPGNSRYATAFSDPRPVPRSAKNSAQVRRAIPVIQPSRSQYATVFSNSRVGTERPSGFH